MVSPLLLGFMSLLAEEWNYTHGGADWEEGLCQDGLNQSPINIMPENLTVIQRGSEVMDSLDLSFQNLDALGNLTSHNYKLSGNFLNITETYGSLNTHGKSLGFHFHSPSEHLINNRQFDLEMHIVMTDDEDGIIYYVLGLLFQVNGKTNKFINSVIDAYTTQTTIKLSEAFEGVTQINNFYHYQGSLTTPPCSEIVNWFIWPKLLDLDSTQLTFFSKFWAENEKFADGHGNNRNPQELNGRVIYFFDGVDLQQSFSKSILVSSLILGLLI